MIQNATLGDFFRELSLHPNLKIRLALLSFVLVVLPAAILLSIGVSEGPVLIAMAILIPLCQYTYWLWMCRDDACEQPPTTEKALAQRSVSTRGLSDFFSLPLVRFSRLLGILSILIALGLVVGGFFPLKPDVGTALPAICVALLTTILALWFQARHSRRTRYAEVLAEIWESTRLLKDRRLDTVEDCQDVIEEIVNETAEAFSIVTSKRCSSWVKRIGSSVYSRSDLSRLEIHDVARDKKSKWRSKIISSSLLVDNSHFLSLVIHVGEPEGRAFFSNNLPGNRTYRTSSFRAYGEANLRNVPISESLVRSVTGWVLPYRSQVVVPVISRIHDAPLICGYLEVDSNSRDVFDSHFDITLLEIFSNLLSAPLMKLNRLSLEETEDPQEGWNDPRATERGRSRRETS